MYDRLQLYCMTALPQVGGDYPAIFVLWASEHFRSSYDGSGLKWSFLIDALERTLDRQQLVDITERGLRFWRRPLRTGDHHRLFLQSLLVEGGLPQELLKPDARYRNQIIRLVSDAEMRGPLASEALPGLVRSAISSWPEGLRQDDVADLVAQLVLRLVELRRIVPSDIPRSASVEWLDGKMPGWRDELPLNIGVEAARSLLDDALRAERRSPQHKDFALRAMRRSENGSWLPFVDFPDNASVDTDLITLSDNTIQTMRLRPSGALASKVPGLMLRGDRSEDGANWKLRRSSGRRTQHVRWPLDEALEFSILADGKVAREITIPGLEMPGPERALAGIWIAREKSDDNPDVLEFLTEGRAATSASRVFLHARNDAIIECSGELQIVRKTPCGNHKLIEMTGQGHIICDAQKITIKTASDEEFGAQIRPLGDVVSGIRTLSREVVFQGWPQFFGAEAGSYGATLSARRLRVLKPGGKWDVFREESAFGGSTIGWFSDGEIIARQRIWMLPDAFGLTFDETPDARCINLVGLPVGVLVTCEGQSAQTNVDGKAQLSLAALPKHATRMELLLALGNNKLRLKVDIWTRSGAIIGPDDLELSRRTSIARDRLSEWRLYCPDQVAGTLSVQLKAAAGTFWPATSFNLDREASLGAYASFIKSALSLGGPDAEIEISVVANGQETPKLSIAHATSRLKVGAEWIGWDDSEVETLEWQSLSQPQLSLSQTVCHGEREAQVPDELDLAASPWMVTARVRGGGALRPAVLPPPPLVPLNEPGAFSLDLQVASDAPTRDRRIAGIADCFRHRSADASNSDWTLLELLVDKVSEYTDSAWLDQVQALAKVPEAAAILLLRGASSKLADRLTLEEEAPFAWITLPLSTWNRAVRACHRNLLVQLGATGLPEATVESIAQEKVLSLCESLCSLRPELSAQIFFSLLAHFPPLDVMARGITPPHDPMKKIEEQAERAVKRRLFAGCKLPELTAIDPWTNFDRYQPESRALLLAPIVAAELVMKDRKDWPKVAIGLLQARHIDPIYFEETLPTAVAYLFAKNEEK
jgi:hypothetical protein